MLATLADYIFWWHLPVVLVIIAAWIFVGGAILRRRMRRRVSRREAAPARCVWVATLAGLGGAVAAAVVLFLVLALVERITVATLWLPLGAASLTFLLVSYLVLYAFYDLPARRVAGGFAAAFAPAIVLAAALGVPSAWYAYTVRQATLSRIFCLRRLGEIYEAIRLRSFRSPDRPAARLEDLLSGEGSTPVKITCPAREDRAVGYFFLPAPLKPSDANTQRVLACDFQDNHGGEGRSVLFTTGRAEWYDERAFQDLLKLPENRAFAEALRQADTPP